MTLVVHVQFYRTFEDMNCYVQTASTGFVNDTVSPVEIMFKETFLSICYFGG